jgi:hypothetical protein
MNAVIRVGAIAAASLVLITCASATTTTSVRDDGEMVRARLIAANTAVLDGTVTVMRFPAPPEYHAWRAEVEECSGLTRPGEVTYWIAAVQVMPPKQALGMYIRSERRIIFGLGFETAKWVFSHETLHDLLNIPDAQNTHPAEYFARGTPCGDLVNPPA